MVNILAGTVGGRRRYGTVYFPRDGKKYLRAVAKIELFINGAPATVLIPERLNHET